MSMDFNDAESNSYDLIPDKTVAPMILTIRPGAHGDGGWETKSKSSDVTMLNAEFAITDGPFRGRKFWGNLVVTGGKSDESGNSIAGNITRSTLRGILESSRGIKADDMSEDARKKRMVSGYGDFSGMEFTGKIGIEKGRDGYDDKNKLVGAVPSGSVGRTGEVKSIGQVIAAKSAAKPGVPAWAA